MPNTEWYEKKPYMEEIDLYRSDDTSCQIYDMPKILAHHRKMIIGEIKKELEGTKLADAGCMEHWEPNCYICKKPWNQALDYIISLPCLKENE